MSWLESDAEVKKEHDNIIVFCWKKIKNNEKNKNKSDTIIVVLCEHDDYITVKIPNLIKELNKLYNKCHYILFLNHDYFGIEKEEKLKYENPHGILELNNDLVKYYDRCNFSSGEKEHIITNKYEDYILDLYKNTYKNIISCKVLHETCYTIAFMCDNSEDIEKIINKIPKYEIKKLK